MFTASLWVLSEIIGSSKCKAGGVFEFMVYGFCVEVRRERPIEQPIVSREETSLLMAIDNVE